MNDEIPWLRVTLLPISGGLFVYLSVLLGLQSRSNSISKLDIHIPKSKFNSPLISSGASVICFFPSRKIFSAVARSPSVSIFGFLNFWISVVISVSNSAPNPENASLIFSKRNTSNLYSFTCFPSLYLCMTAVLIFLYGGSISSMPVIL